MGVASAAKRSPRTTTRKPKIAPPGELVVELNGPGMTPLLRAGIGGLASALRALAREEPGGKWPTTVKLASGEVFVEPRRVVLRFGSAGPKPMLAELFARVFRLNSDGVICPLGIFDGTPTLGMAIALQTGWKRTFLQHGRSTKKGGAARIVQTEIDDHPLRYLLHPFTSYAHQSGDTAVMDALSSGHVELAGWAYPGAAQRHVGFSDTKCEYTAEQAIAAMFSLIGCLSFPSANGGGGVLVIPVPNDLITFAALRPRLTPKKVSDIYVTGVSDAVLGMLLALKASEVEGKRGVQSAAGLLLQTLPWAKQQKSRSWTLEAGAVPERRLDIYANLVAILPSRVRISTTESGEGEQDGEGFFVATSAFRAFVADNIAQDRPWYAGFATANTGGKRPRYVHYFRDRDGGLGALYPEEKKGIMAMLDHLERSEQLLVTSVHLALRGRFAQIAKEAREVPATMKNRFRGERERLRLSFANAKTADQVRSALADLWSRGGPNRDLQEGWRDVLQMFRPESWQLVRDLALLALASYRSASRLDEDDDVTSDEDANEPR